MVSDFPELDFLQNESAAQIHANMLANIPAEMDKTEGGFVWDLTYPTALEKAQAAEYIIPEAIKSMFPLWAEDTLLDMHAANRGITRKQAVYAAGEVTFTGSIGSTVPAGTLVAITASGDEAPLSFATLAALTLAAATGSVAVRAVNPGASGNVATGRINRIEQPVTGVTSVTNAAATAGGLNVESDAALRERILEYDHKQGESYVGSVSDYKRWALEVQGVGDAKVIPASDSSGTITILATDSSGQPASTELQQAIYEHIMRASNPESRLAPINASLTVSAPTTLNIYVAATLVLSSAVTLSAVTATFLAALENYFTEAVQHGKVRYARVGALLLSIPGIEDYSAFTLNSGTANITIDVDELPATSATMISLTQ